MPVEAGETFSGIGFYLWPQPAASISGVVVGPDGPVDNQMLRLIPDTGEDFGAGFETAATVTEVDGSFIFPMVPRGSYFIDARGASSAPSPAPSGPVPTGQNVRTSLWSKTPVSVATDDVEDLPIVMLEGATIEGSVGFEGQRGIPADKRDDVHIRLQPVRGGRAGTPDVFPDEFGMFTIPGVLPDRYFVDVDTPAGWFVESIVAGGNDLTSRPLDTTGANSVGLAVKLTDRGAALLGTVRGPLGLVLPASSVVVFPVDVDPDIYPPLRTREVRTDESGVFRMAGLPPGRYAVVALLESDAGDWQAPHRLASLRSSATIVTLRSGESRTQDLRLNPGR